MIRLGKRAFLTLVGSLAMLVALTPSARAQADPVGAAPSLAELLHEFGTHYRPGTDLLEATWQVESLGRQAELDALPRVTFSERVSWLDYERFSLELELATTIPLYRAKAEPLAALQAQRRALLSAETAFLEAQARSHFARDLLSLSLLRSLAGDADAALNRARDSGWRPPLTVGDALTASPDERERLALYRRVQELHRFADGQLPLFERRVATALGGTVSAPPLPAFEELLSQLAATPPALERCRVDSPLAHQARLRHQQLTLEAQARQAVDVRIDLQGGAAYRSGNFTAAVGLEARVPLPASAPVAGQVGVAAALDGVDQTLRLTWPAAAPAVRPVEAAERAAALAAELDRLEAELYSLQRAAGAAADEIAAAEVQLLWFVRDSHRAWEMEVEAVRELALRPAVDPWSELQLVQLRGDLAFARLAHAERLLDLALVCGAEP